MSYAEVFLEFTTAFQDPKKSNTDYYSAGQLAKSPMKIVKLYARGGFVNRLVLMDMKLEKFEYKVDLLEVNTKAAREHVADIEKKSPG